MSFRLEFSRRFSMAHRLIEGDSASCAVPHGHNETVTVTLVSATKAALDGRANMLEPFERAKGRWHAWIDGAVDHALQLNRRDPLIDYFRTHEPERLGRIMVFPGDPTTEALAACFKAKLSSFLTADGGRLSCAAVRIEETPTNAVIFDGDACRTLPGTHLVDGGTPWWLRADESINDFGGAGTAAA